MEAFMNAKALLLESLVPVMKRLKTIDLSKDDAAVELNALFPVEGNEMEGIKKQVLAGLEEGWLCPRDGGGLRYGRLCKPAATESAFSIDTVDMSGPGPGHVHPNGEIDLCFTVEGKPTFDGNPEGWTVYKPGTWHIPTVEGGRMGILYFLPEGSIQFTPEPPSQSSEEA
jgi:hypothetical protein